MDIKDNLEGILGCIRWENETGYQAGFSMTLGPRGWVAKFTWYGKTLKATAGTAEEALQKLSGLAGQRNCVDAQIVA